MPDRLYQTRSASFERQARTSCSSAEIVRLESELNHCVFFWQTEHCFKCGLGPASGLPHRQAVCRRERLAGARLAGAAAARSFGASLFRLLALVRAERWTRCCPLKSGLGAIS